MKSAGKARLKLERRNRMTLLRYRSLYWVALLVIGVLAGCSSDGEQSEGQGDFSGVHVFEGQVAEGDGGNYVLVIGDVSYELEGNNDEIRQFSGQTVEVAASIAGNTLQVTRIGPPAPPAAAH
jgi:hypothetical protein